MVIMVICLSYLKMKKYIYGTAPTADRRVIGAPTVPQIGKSMAILTMRATR